MEGVKKDETNSCLSPSECVRRGKKQVLHLRGKFDVQVRELAVAATTTTATHDGRAALHIATSYGNHPSLPPGYQSPDVVVSLLRST